MHNHQLVEKFHHRNSEKFADVPRFPLTKNFNRGSLGGNVLSAIFPRVSRLSLNQKKGVNVCVLVCEDTHISHMCAHFRYAPTISLSSRNKIQPTLCFQRESSPFVPQRDAVRKSHNCISDAVGRHVAQHWSLLTRW